MDKKVRLGVALSGGGRTLENFFERIEAGTLNAEVTSVAASNSKAYGLERARKRGVPTTHFLRKNFDSDETYARAYYDFFEQHGCDLVCLAGFMKFFHVPEDYQGRVMNIHPALIPMYCGKGFYGERVHEAVVEAGLKVSGCTVHFANNEYDCGPIIVQKCVPVHDSDTPDDLAARVFQEECEAFPEAINLFAAYRLEIDGKIVRIRPA